METSYFKTVRKKVQWAFKKHTHPNCNNFHAVFFSTSSMIFFIKREAGTLEMACGCLIPGKKNSMRSELPGRCKSGNLSHCGIFLVHFWFCWVLWLHDKTLQLGKETRPIVCSLSTCVGWAIPLRTKPNPQVSTHPWCLFTEYLKYSGRGAFPEGPNAVEYRPHSPKDE